MTKHLLFVLVVKPEVYPQEMREKVTETKTLPTEWKSVFTGIKKNDLVNCNVFLMTQTQGIPYVSKHVLQANCSSIKTHMLMNHKLWIKYIELNTYAFKINMPK